MFVVRLIFFRKGVEIFKNRDSINRKFLIRFRFPLAGTKPPNPQNHEYIKSNTFRKESRARWIIQSFTSIITLDNPYFLFSNHWPFYTGWTGNPSQNTGFFLNSPFTLKRINFNYGGGSENSIISPPFFRSKIGFSCKFIYVRHTVHCPIKHAWLG